MAHYYDNVSFSLFFRSLELAHMDIIQKVDDSKMTKANKFHDLLEKHLI
jgi:hypothetical protein